MAGQVKATVDIGQLLIAGLTIFAEYKKGRDRVIAAGDPTTPTGDLKSDKELIDLMGLDADELVQHTADLAAKYRAMIAAGDTTHDPGGD